MKVLLFILVMTCYGYRVVRSWKSIHISSTIHGSPCHGPSHETTSRERPKSAPRSKFEKVKVSSIYKSTLLLKFHQFPGPLRVKQLIQIEFFVPTVSVNNFFTSRMTNSIMKLQFCQLGTHQLLRVHFAHFALTGLLLIGKIIRWISKTTIFATVS